MKKILAAVFTWCLLAGPVMAQMSSGSATVPGVNQVACYNSVRADQIIPCGGQVVTVRVVTAAGAVTVATTDYFVCINKTSGAATAANLFASPVTGSHLVIKDCKGDAGTNNITITPAAGNIDGAGTYVISTNYGSAEIVYNATQWNVMAKE